MQNLTTEQRHVIARAVNTVAEAARSSVPGATPDDITRLVGIIEVTFIGWLNDLATRNKYNDLLDDFGQVKPHSKPKRKPPQKDGE